MCVCVLILRKQATVDPMVAIGGTLLGSLTAKYQHQANSGKLSEVRQAVNRLPA